MLVDFLTLKALKGKRTYLLVAGALVTIAVQYATGDSTLGEAVQNALGLLGLATLRAAK